MTKNKTWVCTIGSNTLIVVAAPTAQTALETAVGRYPATAFARQLNIKVEPATFTLKYRPSAVPS